MHRSRQLLTNKALVSLAQCLYEPKFKLNGHDVECEMLLHTTEQEKPAPELQKADSIRIDVAACSDTIDSLPVPYRSMRKSLLHPYDLHLRPETSDQAVMLQVRIPCARWLCCALTLQWLRRHK